MKTDLLKELQSYVGCVYISDIRLQPHFNKETKRFLVKIDLREYSLREINDAIKYIYDIDSKFINFDDVEKFIKKQVLL